MSTANKVKADGVVYDLEDTSARTLAAEAKAEAALATERVKAIAPLNHALVYKVTTDEVADPTKFYYEYIGDGQYKQMTKGASFESGKTYYEIDTSNTTTPQVLVDSTMPSELPDSWDKNKFVTGAGVAIGHHARALAENDAWNWNIAIGQNATAGDGDAGDQACAIGEQSIASKYSCTAVGSKSKATGYGSCCIGYGGEAAATFSLALGKNAKAAQTADGAIMIGPGENKEPSSVYFGVTECVYTVVPTATHTKFLHGTSYFTRTGSGTTADPYLYAKYNGEEGATIPTDPVIYIMSTVNSKTYKVLGKDGKIPVERLDIDALKAALGL